MSNEKSEKMGNNNPPLIYESPDRGETVFAREFGADHSTRVMIMKDGVKIDE